MTPMLRMLPWDMCWRLLYGMNAARWNGKRDEARKRSTIWDENKLAHAARRDLRTRCSIWTYIMNDTQGYKQQTKDQTKWASNLRMEPLMLQTAQTLQTVAAVQVRQFLHTSHSLQVIIINAECQNAQSLQAGFTFDPTETPNKDVIENFSKKTKRSIIIKTR